MNDSSGQLDELLEAYLDDTLEGSSRVRIEDAIAADPDLARQVAIARQIERSLQQSFAPPEAPSGLIALLRQNAVAVEPTPPASSGSRGNGKHRVWLIAVAAGLICVSVFWLLWRSRITAETSPSGYARIAMATVYREAVDRGFEPLWECPPRRFAMTFAKRQGTPLLLDELPPRTRMVGLSYLAGLRPTSTSMLARVDEQEVIVWVERLSRDRPIEPPDPDSSLHLFRDERFGLVFYELSPLPRPTLMPRFIRAERIPSEDATWPATTDESS